MDTIKELLCKGKQDDDALMQLIDRLKPLLSKYTFMLNYYGAETDLIICLIEFVKNIDIEKFTSFSEGETIIFIKKLIKNKAIDLNRKQKTELFSMNELDLDVIAKNLPCEKIDLDVKMDIVRAIDKLNPKTKKIIILRLLYGFSDAEIADYLHISRQAVNKSKNRALESIRADMEVL